MVFDDSEPVQKILSNRVTHRLRLISFSLGTVVFNVSLLDSAPFICQEPSANFLNTLRHFLLVVIVLTVFLFVSILMNLHIEIAQLKTGSDIFLTLQLRPLWLENIKELQSIRVLNLFFSSSQPIKFRGDVRLNVEEKKTRSAREGDRRDMRPRGPGGPGGPRERIGGGGGPRGPPTRGGMAQKPSFGSGRGAGPSEGRYSAQRQ